MKNQKDVDTLDQYSDGESNRVMEAESPNDRKRYSGGVKLRAVMRLLEGEKQVDVAHSMGVSQPLLSVWKRRAMDAVCREFRLGPATGMKPSKTYHEQIANDDQRAVDLNGTLETMTQQFAQTMRALENKLHNLEAQLHETKKNR